jgi:hypothetical protein
MRNPPTLAVGLLRRLLSDRDRNIILGDLLEEFQDRGAEADRWYLRQVVGFLTLARLTRLIPPRVAFAAAAGLAEYAIFWVLPALAGVRPEWGPFSIVCALLCICSVLVVVRRESDAALTAKFVGMIAVSWFLPFAGIAAWVFHRPEFSPFPAVLAFLGCVFGASLQAAAMRGRVALGVSAAVTTGLLAAGLAGVTLNVSGAPHPPLQTLPFLPGMAAFLGAIGGLFGSRFGHTRNQLLLPGLHIGA